MKRFVLDCSVAMSWCFDDETSEYTEAVLDLLKTAEALVPTLWPLEVTNVLLVAERRKRLTEAQSIQFIDLLGDLPIHVHEESSGRAFTDVFYLAREHDLSTYDAAYLELAIREGIPIATRDKTLGKAAKKAGLELIK